MTPQRLRNVALAYLQRHGGSRARLTQVLTRRAERSMRHHDMLHLQDEVHGWIAEVVADLCAQGACDDQRQARVEAISQSLLGRPRRAIVQRLRVKGFEAEAIEQAMSALHTDADAGAADPDWVACCRFARRRGLGPFRSSPDTPKERQRQLAALMRAGFGYGHARRVLETAEVDELQRVIDEAALPSL